MMNHVVIPDPRHEPRIMPRHPPRIHKHERG
jgi:hypothetical protein